MRPNRRPLSVVGRDASLRACLVATAVLTVAFGVPALLGSHHFGFDLSRVDLGMLCALKERLASGEGFWISPLLGNGDPLLAKPEAQIFYPPRWIALLLPVDAAISFYVVLHLALAAAFAAWLARTFALRPVGAACAGVGFAFSGTVLDLITHSHYLASATWLPLVWAGARRGLGSRGRGWHLVAVGGALAAVLLAGEPQAFCIGSVLVMVEVGGLLLRSTGRSKARAARFALAPVVAFGIALAQWSAILGELSLGPRKAGLPMGEALMWPFSPPMWVATVVPGLLTQRVSPLPNIWHVWHSSLAEHYPWNPQPYWGALLLVGICTGFTVRRARPASMVLGVAVLFALGAQTPVLPLLMKVLAPLALFRFPAKYLVIAGLAGTMVAAIGFQQVLRRRRLRHFAIAGGGFSVALIAAIVCVWLWRDRIDLLPRAIEPTDWRLDFPLLSEALIRLLAQGLGPLAIALGLGLAMPNLRAFVPVLMALDLALAAPYATYLGPGLAHGPSPVRESAEPRGPTGMVLCVDPSIENKLLGLASDRVEWDQTLYQRTHLLPEMQACDGIVSALPYSALVVSLNLSLQRGVAAGSASAARALGCTDLLADKPPYDDPQAVLKRFPIRVADHPEVAEKNWFVNVFEIRDPLPEFFVATDAVLSTSESDALRRIGPSKTAAELLKVVDDPLHRLSADQGLPIGASAKVVGGRWLERRNARVELAGTGAAVIGVRSSFHVGWVAAQGGRALPVVRVAGNQLGVVVDDVAAGAIELVYRSPYFGAGMLGSLAGLAALAALAIWQRRSVGRR